MHKKVLYKRPKNEKIKPKQMRTKKSNRIFVNKLASYIYNNNKEKRPLKFVQIIERKKITTH